MKRKVSPAVCRGIVAFGMKRAKIDMACLIGKHERMCNMMIGLALNTAWHPDVTVLEVEQYGRMARQQMNAATTSSGQVCASKPKRKERGK